MGAAFLRTHSETRMSALSCSNNNNSQRQGSGTPHTSQSEWALFPQIRNSPSNALLHYSKRDATYVEAASDSWMPGPSFCPSPHGFPNRCEGEKYTHIHYAALPPYPAEFQGAPYLPGGSLIPGDSNGPHVKVKGNGRGKADRAADTLR